MEIVIGDTWIGRAYVNAAAEQFVDARLIKDVGEAARLPKRARQVLGLQLGDRSLGGLGDLSEYLLEKFELIIIVAR